MLKPIITDTRVASVNFNTGRGHKCNKIQQNEVLCQAGSQDVTICAN